MIRYQTARFVDERDALESRINRLYLTIGVGLEGSNDWEKVLGTTRTVSRREWSGERELMHESIVCGSHGRRLPRSNVS